MKYSLFGILLLMAGISFASEESCENHKDALSSLSDVLGSKCIPGTTKSIKEDIETDSDLRDQCQRCGSKLSTKLDKEDFETKRENLHGETILNELQKNLTFLTVDLMRIRSSFKLDFDGKSVAKRCEFTNLKKPPCLTPEQEKLYNNKIQSIQSSLAQEMANILSPAPSAQIALLDRSIDSNSCGFTDKDILYAQNRYIEGLFNKKTIQELKEMKLPKNVKVLDHISKMNLPKSWEERINDLKKHPLLEMLMNQPAELNNFLSDITEKDDDEMIIKKLYSREMGKKFGQSVESRCQEAFSQTSKLMEENFCKKTPLFVAKDLKSMQVLIGRNFSEFKKEEDAEAEAKLQELCQYLNESDEKTKSFSHIQELINGDQDISIAKSPMSTFKKEAFRTAVSDAKSQICEAKNGKPDCKNDDKHPSCQMLKFYDLAHAPGPYQEMAKASGDNINLILRSLVGEGRPETQEHLVLLQNEGILPGGTIADKPVQQDPETFHRTVSNNNGSNSPTINQKAGGPTGDPKLSGRQIASTETNSDSEFSGSNFAYSGNKTGSNSEAPEFSNLSGEEQDQFMDRLNRMGKIRKGKNVGRGDNTTANDEQVVKKGEKTHWAKPARNNDNNETDVNDTPVISGRSVASTADVGGGSTSGAGGINKDFRSYNSALLKANENMGAPNVDGTPTVNELSKTKTGENEINIQVEDAELAQINKFKGTLVKLLAVHNEELSVKKVGEKFVVKLNDYVIDVIFDRETRLYKAECRNSKIPDVYKDTISNYFNVTLNQGPGKIKSLQDAFQISKKN